MRPRLDPCVFYPAQFENGHMLIYLSKTMREIASGSKSVSFTKASNGFMTGGGLGEVPLGT